MKYLLRVLFILALFCGLSSVARADTLDFHSGAVDPACNGSLTECGLGLSDIGQSFPVALSQAQCTSSFISPPLTGLPDPTVTPYGCFLGINTSGESITSITLHFSSINGVTGCDTDLLPGAPSQIFTNNTCNPDTGPLGGFDLSFSGGSGVPDGHIFVILEEGVDPGDFTGTAVVASTPEPDSLLLLSTGMMMMGLYMAGRTRLFAFLKK
jgi:hypothetical protein